MKRCTYCGKEHPDEATVCSLDRQPLESFDPMSAPPDSHAQLGKGWMLEVFAPAVAWVIVNFLLASRYTGAVALILAPIIAIGAAIDCSKFQSRGSRALGIAFKPVVVFAVVAVFFWGFGFIWYLHMRYRVKTAVVNMEEN